MNTRLQPDYYKEVVQLLPTMHELIVGQQVLAEYCNRMISFGKERNALEIYDYYRRLADVVTDPNLSVLVVPILFKADKIWEEHIQQEETAKQRTRNMEALRYGKPQVP